MMRWWPAIRLACVAAFGVGVLSLLPTSPNQSTAAPPQPKTDEFIEKIRPVLVKTCITCHNDKKQAAGLSLEEYVDSASAKKHIEVLEKIRELVETKQMPPEKKPQPTEAERQTLLAWIDKATKIDCGLARDPGRPTIRRLNRNEYDNTIRDLVAVDFKPAEDFPSDDVGYGFDHIGDVLSMPPILLEKYLAAADRIVEKAIVLPKPIKVNRDVFNPQNVRVNPPNSKKDRLITLGSNGSAVIGFEFPFKGEYILRARAYGDRAGKDLPKLSFDINKKSMSVVDVDALAGKAKVYEARVTIEAGRQDVGFSFINDFMDDKAPADSKEKDRNLYIERMEIEGPFNPVAPPLPESHRRIMIAQAKDAGDREAARKIIHQFATKAYRRPAKPEETERLLKLFDLSVKDKEPFEEAIKNPLKAVLVSPHFLFRIERDPAGKAAGPHTISAYELATRLSYFLWSTMPDDELIQLAGSGKLLEPAVLEQQVRRMLKDPKASSMVENFAGQWLMLRSLATLNPDQGTYKSFTSELRADMIKETELFFEHIMREDRKVTEFLDSDYTFLNSRLARHYGIDSVRGSEFRKVSLTNRTRGGILTQASILTVTSNPTRTSPVKRGKWILENILGTPPPPPPPDVPELDNDKAALTGSLRQRMEKHRDNPSCASCHARLDPLGFGLENFDGVGAFRATEGNFKIDASGVLPDGAKFNGPEELRKVLMTKSDLFRKNLADRMLTYALGRGLESYDKCTIEDIVTNLKKGDDRFSALVLAVVKSDAFLKRRGMAIKP